MNKRLRKHFLLINVAGILLTFMIYSLGISVSVVQFTSEVELPLTNITREDATQSERYDSLTIATTAKIFHTKPHSPRHASVLQHRRNGRQLPPECPVYPPTLVGFQMPLLEEKEEEMGKLFHVMKAGGTYTPPGCHPDQKTAIIIPYRNRRNHINILLLNLIPFLVRQQLSFTIFVIEMDQQNMFNKALLLNAGVQEALMMDSYDCFVFQDVDLLPLDDRNLYRCGQQPRHLAVSLNKWDYRIKYKETFGGVTALSRAQIEKVNGCSNLYFGWGGEDDDLYRRITFKGMSVERNSLDITRYYMIRHDKDKGNEINPLRYKLLETATNRMYEDGLNTAKYNVNSVEFKPFYTWIKISFNVTAVIMSAPIYERSILLKETTWQNRIDGVFFCLIVLTLCYFYFILLKTLFLSSAPGLQRLDN